MPDDKTPPTPPAEPTPEEQAEKAFWEKFEANLDGWFEKKMEKYRGTSPTRTGGRTTLPGFMADLIFGPPKDK